MTRGLVLLTRPLADSKRVAEIMEADGIPSLIWPLMRITPVEIQNPIPPGIDGLLITSAHGIRAFASLNQRRDLPVLCVGGRTAEIARGLGFGMVLSAEGDAEALARLANGTPCRHFFYPRGRDVSHDLETMLKPSGKRVSEQVVYAAVPAGDPPAPVASALKSGTVGIVTLWSVRNAKLFAEWVRANGADLRGTDLIALSQQVAMAADDLGFRTSQTATESNAAALIEAVRRAVATRID
ncbi:MAG: uroporphyrinogen-III synthase [Pseudomonadota bacterium]